MMTVKHLLDFRARRLGTIGLGTLWMGIGTLWLTAGGLPAEAAEAGRPNVLLIMADDLGYSDLGCYGGEIRTPHLDRLAENGLRYTRFYNSARCCPSRASLLTGLYPHQTGIGHFVGNRPRMPEAYRGRLLPNTVTVAELLKKSGYRTFMTGKWHVNEPVPTQQGFEEFYGFVHGYATDSWNPEMMIRLPEGRPERRYDDGEFFAADAVTDYALDFLNQARDEPPDQPWFLYVAYRGPHFPVQAPLEDTAKYHDQYRRGWDYWRQERLARMKDLGIVDDETKLSPRGYVPIPRIAERNGVPGDPERNPPWEDLSEARRQDLARRMAVYAGMVDNMDQNIGRIIEDLEEAGDLEETLVIFLSDNGACAEWDPFGFDLTEEMMSSDERGVGIRGATPDMPNRLHSGDELERMGGPDGNGFSYGSGWANVSNTPWSGYKMYTYEGGVTTPLIVHWPDGIRQEHQGSLRHQRGYIFDLAATCLDVAEAEYPRRHEGQSITPIEGESLVPTFDDEELADRPLIFEHFGNAAITEGHWKLVAQGIIGDNGLRDDRDWELYNLRGDRTEIRDLADEHPDEVRRLEKVFLNEAWRTKIFPNTREN